MHTVTERLCYLRSREALAAVVLPAVIVWKWWAVGGDIAWGARLASLALLAGILVQGTLYWHLKLRAIAAQAPLPSWFHALFRGFQWSNLAGMGLVSAFLLWSGPGVVSGADIAWCAGLLAGVALEQVNYYHYQLMIDTRASFDYVRRNGRLRKAALGIDIARSRPNARYGAA